MNNGIIGNVLMLMINWWCDDVVDFEDDYDGDYDDDDDYH